MTTAMTAKAIVREHYLSDNDNDNNNNNNNNNNINNTNLGDKNMH